MYTRHPWDTLLTHWGRPRQNGRHFADDIFKCIFLNENVWIPIKIPMKFVPKGPINNIPALVQIMAWLRSSNKPLSEPRTVSLTTHICVTRPQWVKAWRGRFCLRSSSLQHLYRDNGATGTNTSESSMTDYRPSELWICLCIINWIMVCKINVFYGYKLSCQHTRSSDVQHLRLQHKVAYITAWYLL